MFGAGAVGHCHTPPSVKDFCSPFTKSRPGLASGTLITVPRDFPLCSFVMLFTILFKILGRAYFGFRVRDLYFFFVNFPMIPAAGPPSEPSSFIVKTWATP